ncbi:hypothetical protein FBR05_04655 [Deltaproteobacteria bacterium PRO3]|nr:hypothetical protein [Deltaproteobacteria bacterium PRO3]
MSQEICIDPRTYYLETPQVCEAPLETLPSASPANSPTGDAFVSTLPPPPPASRLAVRDSATFRAALLRDAFGALPRHEAPHWDSPVAYSLWALFPAACDSHPPLHNEAGGDSSEGGFDGGDAETPPALSLTGFTTHDTAPCGAAGLVTDLDEGLGVCANYATNDHHLFSWDPARPGAAASIIPLTWAPDQVLRAADGEIFITTHQNPGLAAVRPEEGSESHHPFPASLPTSATSSSGRALAAIRPAYPKGLVEIEGQVFIATSNYDEVHDDYQPGTVLAFQRATGNFGVLSTSGYNPTSVGVADGRLLVVSSGAVDRNGLATTDGFLDVFDPLSHDLVRSIPLGQRGAGVSGEISLSPDGGTAYLPTADNSGRILAVNLNNGTLREISMTAAGVSGARIFFPSLQVGEDGRYGIAANFNDGKVYPLDLTSGTLSAPPLAIDGDTADGEGLSDGLRIGADYFVGLGPRLLRLQADR